MEGRFETFDANEHFVVVRDDLGYGVWRFDELLEGGEPIERFPDDDSGYEAAAARWRELSRADRRSRSPWTRWLKICVILAAAIAFVSSIVFAVTQLWSDPFSSPEPADIQYWSAVISQTAFQVTIVLFAIYAVVWLDSRGHR
jgi:hypothetical protein